jgi:hypothetical protein
MMSRGSIGGRIAAAQAFRNDVVNRPKEWIVWVNKPVPNLNTTDVAKDWILEVPHLLLSPLRHA